MCVGHFSSPRLPQHSQISNSCAPQKFPLKGRYATFHPARKFYAKIAQFQRYKFLVPVCQQAACLEQSQEKKCIACFETSYHLHCNKAGTSSLQRIHTSFAGEESPAAPILMGEQWRAFLMTSINKIQHPTCNSQNSNFQITVFSTISPAIVSHYPCLWCLGGGCAEIYPG